MAQQALPEVGHPSFVEDWLYNALDWADIPGYTLKFTAECGNFQLYAMRHSDGSVLELADSDLFETTDTYHRILLAPGKERALRVENLGK